jgi:DNA primase catalytic core
VDTRELDSADDRAAVLDWRLDDTERSQGEGRPLPWLPAVPHRLRDDPTWGRDLSDRAATIVELADHVRARAGAGPRPEWADHGGSRSPAGVVGDVEVWRAAMQVPAEEWRPTGPVQLHRAARIWQRRLDQAVAADHPAWREWGWLIEKIGPGVRSDPFGPVVAERLAAISRAGLDAREFLRSAASGKSLPDDHAAAALWWRISRHLTPAVSARLGHNHSATASWARLAPLIGGDRARAVHSSPWWPALVTAVDRGLQRGWRLKDLMGSASDDPHTAADECQAMVWRISVALEPAPEDHRYGPHSTLAVEENLWRATEATDEAAVFVDCSEESAVTASHEATAPDREAERWVEPDLAVAAMVRDVAGPPEQSDADIDRMFARALAWRECPSSRERMVEVNQLSLDYFRRHFLSSWGQEYLTYRFGQDIADSRFQPGQAPAGWTGLVEHLRRQGVTDQEMTLTGAAAVASTGRLIDRFRNRIVFPIIHDGAVLGFVGRRHPNLTDGDRRAPKYLNTAATPLFHKGAQLFGLLERPVADGAIPVIVEGPMDAVAVTIASGGRHIGVATLGTTLTDEQAAQVTGICPHPVVATDADIAGQIAAERDFWILTPYRLDPVYAQLPEGSDPADLLARAGPAALIQALDAAQPLAQRLLDERLATNLPKVEVAPSRRC